MQAIEDPRINIIKNIAMHQLQQTRVKRVIIRKDEKLFYIELWIDISNVNTISLWRLISLEDKIAEVLKLKYLTSHSRLGIIDNRTLKALFIYRMTK